MNAKISILLLTHAEKLSIQMGNKKNLNPEILANFKVFFTL